MTKPKSLEALFGGNIANGRMVSEMLVTFKLQVQKWKDTLLRGKNPAKLQGPGYSAELRAGRRDFRSRAGT